MKIKMDLSHFMILIPELKIYTQAVLNDPFFSGVESKFIDLNTKEEKTLSAEESAKLLNKLLKK